MQKKHALYAYVCMFICVYQYIIHELIAHVQSASTLHLDDLQFNAHP